MCNLERTGVCEMITNLIFMQNDTSFPMLVLLGTYVIALKLCMVPDFALSAVTAEHLRTGDVTSCIWGGESL